MMLTKGRVLAAVALAITTFSSPTFARRLVIPEYLARPNEVVSVPVLLDDAAAVAAAHLRVNYNAQVFTLVGVRNEGLGSAFRLAFSARDGVADIVLTRSGGLLRGSGRLAILDFKPNSGATEGLSSSLALAEYELNDASGVRQLGFARTIQPTSGKLTATFGPIDNRYDEIVDDWEAAPPPGPSPSPTPVPSPTPNPTPVVPQRTFSSWAEEKGLTGDNSLATADGDRDGIPNVLEWAFGFSPTLAEVNGTRLGTVTIDGKKYLSLSYTKPTQYTPSGVTYTPERATRLAPGDWSGSSTDVEEHSVTSGPGDLSTVTVRSRHPISAGTREFLHLKVTLASP